MCGEIFRKEKYLLKCTIVHLKQINNDQRKLITYMSNPQPTDPQAPVPSTQTGYLPLYQHYILLSVILFQAQLLF